MTTKQSALKNAIDQLKVVEDRARLAAVNVRVAHLNLLTSGEQHDPQDEREL